MGNEFDLKTIILTILVDLLSPVMCAKIRPQGLFGSGEDLKGFYHIWAWQPSWSMDHGQFSNLSFPCPNEAPHEILATLSQRFQSRSHLKLSTLFPYKCMGPIQLHTEANLTLPLKIKYQCTTISLATLVDLPSHLIFAKIQPKVSSVLKQKVFKVFYHIWVWRPSWSMDRGHFSNLSFPCPKEVPHEI